MIKINTRQLAKAQRTWFKRFRETLWIDLTTDCTAVEVVDELQRRGGRTSKGPNAEVDKFGPFDNYTV